MEKVNICSHYAGPRLSLLSVFSWWSDIAKSAQLSLDRPRDPVMDIVAVCDLINDCMTSLIISSDSPPDQHPAPLSQYLISPGQIRQQVQIEAVNSITNWKSLT